MGSQLLGTYSTSSSLLRVLAGRRDPCRRMAGFLKPAEGQTSKSLLEIDTLLDL